MRLILVRRKLSYVGEGFLWACTAALALEVRLSIYSRRLTANEPTNVATASAEIKERVSNNVYSEQAKFRCE